MAFLSALNNNAWTPTGGHAWKLLCGGRWESSASDIAHAAGIGDKLYLISGRIAGWSDMQSWLKKPSREK